MAVTNSTWFRRIHKIRLEQTNAGLKNMENQNKRGNSYEKIEFGKNKRSKSCDISI